MRIPRKKAVFGLSAGVVAAAALLAFAGEASAQGLFERLFGGFRRAIERPAPPPSAHSFVDPLTALARALNPEPAGRPIGEANPSRGFCVRTCDGHYFPVQTQGGMSAAESCRAFCPATETQLYAGSNIDYAVARDGGRYANLDTAFAYRQKIVPGCTCNGSTPFGLARIDADSDPTLRSGDIVATKDGLVAYNGRSRDFTPVQSYAGFSPSTRAQLSAIRIMPTPPPPPTETTSSIGSDKPAQAADNATTVRGLVP
ncbi:MAG: DUF2865 domain-containing protein [Pseudolabrys sp.]